MSVSVCPSQLFIRREGGASIEQYDEPDERSTLTQGLLEKFL